MQAAQDQACADIKAANEQTNLIKVRIQELEKQNQSLLNEMEKDQALFQDKVKFLTDQKTRLEAEKLDIDRKLKEE